MQNTKENKMGVMPIGRLILNMSLPMMISMLVQAMYNIVDSIYVSRVSEAALTAVSLAFPAQNLMIGLGTGTAVGVNALLSRALGAGDRERANKVAENGVFLALVAYVLFALFGLFGSRIFMSAQTANEEIIQGGADYLSIVCCLSFGVYGQIMFERLMQSTGRTIYTMFTQGIGAIINIILDPIFIFTFGMGVRGAAVATVVGQIIAFGIAVVLNHLKNPDVRLSLRKFRPDVRLIGQIYAIGIPSVIMVGIGSIMTFLMNIILITYTAGKETSATVFGVYFKLNSFAFMPVFGLNNGVIPIIAYNYGAKNRHRMTKAVKVALCYALGFMLLGTVLFMAAPHILLGMFDANEAMLSIGVPALRIIATTFPVAAVCIVLGSVFQALGFGTYSMLTSMARQLLVLVPSAWLLARLGQSVGNDSLVWWSYPIAEVASAAVTAILFIRLYKNIISKVPEGNH
ncbi:MAG: MATE family efflux transporter [Clostridia bacterium]|nr:MATE family efflux transporter [Clostridia bacterium]